MLNFELTSKTATSLKPKRIILVRHGESQGNVDNTIYDRIPDYALELTAKGNEQALQAGENLKQIIKVESVFFYISRIYKSSKIFLTKSVPKTGRGGQVVRAIDLQSLVLSFIYSLIIRRSSHHFKIRDLQTQCIGG